MEIKSLTVEVKAEAEGIITAYASTFNGVDSYGDTIRPGAFTKTIQERKDRIKVLYDHSTSTLPVGRPEALSEDSYGLLTSTKMSQTQLGRDIYTLAQEGALSELSIGYVPIKMNFPDIPGDWERELLELKLYEYSFVPFPADERAVITAIKSGPAELERHLKALQRIVDVDLKAGRMMSGENAKRILAAMKELHTCLSAAGLEEAANGTSEGTTAEKSTAEPPTHSALLTELKAWTPTPNLRTPDETAVLAELKAAFAPLRGERA